MFSVFVGNMGQLAILNFHENLPNDGFRLARIDETMCIAYSEKGRERLL